jgi:hypothetical protein
MRSSSRGMGGRVLSLGWDLAPTPPCPSYPPPLQGGRGQVLADYKIFN